MDIFLNYYIAPLALFIIAFGFVAIFGSPEEEIKATDIILVSALWPITIPMLAYQAIKDLVGK